MLILYYNDIIIGDYVASHANRLNETKKDAKKVMRVKHDRCKFESIIHLEDGSKIEGSSFAVICMYRGYE